MKRLWVPVVYTVVVAVWSVGFVVSGAWTQPPTDVAAGGCALGLVVVWWAWLR